MLDEAQKDNKKNKKVKEVDSSKYIETEPTLDEAAGGTAVISWGRMNPMTAGHEKLVKKVLSVAKTEKGMPHVFLTHSYDKKKNPIAYDDKIKYAQKAFGPVVKKSSAKTIFQLMKEINKNFNRVVFVAGSDRVDEFNNTLNKYNGKEYNFDEIKVVSAGARDADADDVSGISGTKMRGYAVTDMKKFAANLPKKIQGDAEEIAALVRKGMNMSESEEIHINEMAELDEALNRQQRRKRAIAMKKARFKIKRGREKAMKRTASMEVLKKRARKQAINKLKDKFAKNRRYAELSSAEKEVVDRRIEKINKKRLEQMARKLLPSVKQAERERRKNMYQKEEVEINEASCADTKVRKRPHMMMDSNNKPKFDGRFRFFKKKPVTESVEDLSEEINDLMEATEALAEKELKKDKDDPCWKNYVQLGTKKKNGKEVPNCVPKEEVELEERSTGDAIKSMIGRVLNKGNYKSALEYMKKSGKSAADVARIYKGVDARTLASMAESVELDEGWKINKNTYFMGKDVGPVRTHHSGYSIAKIGKDWIISNPDDEESGKFKSLAAAKSEVASMVNESARERALTPSYGRRDTYRDKMKRGANELKKQLARKRGEGEQLKLKFEDLRAKLGEKLTAKDDAGEWVKDFQDSDAPQFKGKSDEKKRKMAIAALLDAKRKAKNEEAGAGEEGTNKLVKRYKKDTPNA